MQFPGAPVQLGVRGVAAREFPVEVVRPHGLQLVGELVGERAGLHGGQYAPGVPDDVRVGGEVRVVVHGAAGPFLAQRARDLPGPDPAVAVPLGPAVAQPDTVHHAGAEEPVTVTPAGARVFQSHRVGPVAQVAAVQFRRQGTGHRKVERGDLLPDRRERAFEEWVLFGHDWSPSSPRSRSPGWLDRSRVLVSIISADQREGKAQTRAQPGGESSTFTASRDATGRAWSACSHCPWPESRPKIAADYELNFDRIAPLHAALGVSLPSKRAAIEAHGSTIQATIFDALDALDALDGLDGFDGLDAGRLLAPAGLGGDDHRGPACPAAWITAAHVRSGG